MYQATGDSYWSNLAKQWTTTLASQVNRTGDLSVEFMPSYEPLYEMTKNPAYLQVLEEAAASKNNMWNQTVGAFQTTWRQSNSGNPDANFGVLMDQTEDMELMLWVAKQTNNTTYTSRVLSNVRNVIKYLVRPDGSTAQWAYFDSATGQFIDDETYQGYSNDSTWSRGQAWAIHSFTTIAAETGAPDVLAAAEKVANYFISHLPSDSVPYWDFNDPKIPNALRDSSAAAIAASGLVQLSTLVTGSAAAKYKSAAEKILASLASPAYLAEGTKSQGILLHGAQDVLHDPYGNDVSLDFGDYYFMQAVNRYVALG
jgi:unsaturated chondroitin disaccharide hydrolase